MAVVQKHPQDYPGIIHKDLPGTYLAGNSPGTICNRRRTVLQVWTRQKTSLIQDARKLLQDQSSVTGFEKEKIHPSTAVILAGAVAT